MGSEMCIRDRHGTVIGFLERDRKRARLESRSLDVYEERNPTTTSSSGFEGLVPGLAEISQERRNRRMKAAQVNPEDDEAVAEMMELAEDENIQWEEE